MTGIYGCDTDPGIAHPGTRCYKIITGAAITEWILAVCFVNYLLALGFSSFHGESIRVDMLKSARLAETMKHCTWMFQRGRRRRGVRGFGLHLGMSFFENDICFRLNLRIQTPRDSPAQSGESQGVFPFEYGICQSESRYQISSSHSPNRIVRPPHQINRPQSVFPNGFFYYGSHSHQLPSPGAMKHESGHGARDFLPLFHVPKHHQISLSLLCIAHN